MFGFSFQFSDNVVDFSSFGFWKEFVEVKNAYDGWADVEQEERVTSDFSVQRKYGKWRDHDHDRVDRVANWLHLTPVSLRNQFGWEEPRNWPHCHSKVGILVNNLNILNVYESNDKNTNSCNLFFFNFHPYIPCFFILFNLPVGISIEDKWNETSIIQPVNVGLKLCTNDE